ncbi:uncharacterized protein BJX67DRAFT_358432 [Aspergillus lucknowensis]|uniref:Mtf2-like C-terminal domain-containing protein n=1 Tax=Aspergillus lucknowensis TaxID=176173 RepID=A0ABR4LM08_9EURO
MNIQRRIPRTWLAQVQAYTLRQSLVPFLYQTHTLSALPRAVRSPSQPCSRYSTFDTPEKQVPAEPPTPVGNDGLSALIQEDESQSPSLPATPPRSSYIRKRASGVTWRNMLRNASARKTRSTSSPDHPELEGIWMQHWPSRGGRRRRSVFLNQFRTPPPKPLTRKTRPEPRDETMSKPKMTTQETRALANLFGQLEEERSLDPKEGPSPGERKLGESERQEMEQISAIFDAVMHNMKDRKGRRASRARTTEKQDITRGADTVNLQNGMFTLPSDDEELKELILNDRITLAQVIERVVEREASKIETALYRMAVDEGRGEIGIWKICKERIFSLVQHLEDNERAASVLNELQFPGHQHEDHPTTEVATPESLDVPGCVPIEAVVTALYPKMLLSAFRLLNLHFPESPLIGQFRSTIRSLGRESTVLGTSTELYNELIYFYWRGRHDLPEVVSILHEMEVTGIDPDSRTCGILEAIVAQRHQEQLRGGNQSHESWCDLPQNRKVIRELLGDEGWIQKLKMRLYERQKKLAWMQKWRKS